MKYLVALWLFIVVGCTIFNPSRYNPNPTPMHKNDCHTDSIKVDTIRLTNGIDHIIILDTLKIK